MPMVDVMVAWPGAEPAEVENRIVAPIERILWGVPGVEHIYSVSRPGMGMVTVRFKVNESNETSLVKVYERQTAMSWIMPRDIMPPIIELHSIDDVPFLSLTLWGEGWSSDRLRPLAAELAQELSEVPEASRAQLIGGQPRVVRVEPDPDRMAAAGISWMQLTGALQAASVRQARGHGRPRQPRDPRRGGAALPQLGGGRPRGGGPRPGEARLRVPGRPGRRRARRGDGRGPLLARVRWGGRRRARPAASTPPSRSPSRSGPGRTRARSRTPS